MLVTPGRAPELSVEWEVLGILSTALVPGPGRLDPAEHISTDVHTYPTRVNMCACVSTCVVAHCKTRADSICIHVCHLHTHTPTHTGTHQPMCTHVSMCAHACIEVCRDMLTCVNMHVCVLRHMATARHACAHANAHSQVTSHACTMGTHVCTSTCVYSLHTGTPINTCARVCPSPPHTHTHTCAAREEQIRQEQSRKQK